MGFYWNFYFRELFLWHKLLAALFVFAFAPFQPASAQTYSYSEIVVEGNLRIDTASIIRFADLPRSGTISAATLNSAYNGLADAELFEDISISDEGAVLLITVVEYPIINKIVIEGNRRIKSERLMEVVKSQPRQVYKPSLAEADAFAIGEVYRIAGRFAATVDPKIIRRPDNRVDMVFEVIEGRVVEVERISFVGNKAYSDSRLRKVLRSKQANFLRTFVQSDTFVAERLELDKSLLRDFYLARGYVDFEVTSVSTEVTLERDAFFVVFHIEEGHQFTFGEITTDSDVPEVDVDFFMAESRIKPGRVYTPTLVSDTVERMEFLASSNNLQFVRVRPDVTRNSHDRTLDVVFNVERGQRIFIERIDIQGNATTLDRVIRRQFRVAEGDPLNPREIAEAAERIRALGFFASAEVTSEEGSSPSQAVIAVNVTERPTGSLSFGVAYAEDEGVSGNIQLTERNLLGRGQYLSFGLDTGSKTKSYSLTFGEPQLLDRDLSLTVSTSYRTTESYGQNFDTSVFQFSPQVRFPISETSRLGVKIAFNRHRFSGTQWNKSGVSQIIRRDLFLNENQQRTGDNLTFGYDLSYDSRRTGFDPTRGYQARIGQEVILGRQNYTALRSTVLARAHTSLFNEDLLLSATFEGGAVFARSGDTHLEDRFRTHRGIMRGFRYNGMGPRDPVTEDALGGNYFAVARLESQFPLGFAEDVGISGGAFFDFGSLWGLDDVKNCVVGTAESPQPDIDPTKCNVGVVDDSMKLRATAGVSLFWTTLLGPLRFNFSRPVKKEVYDETLSFDLTISSDF